MTDESKDYEDNGAGLRLLPNGHVRLVFDDGNSVRMRRPKVGEYRQLREMAVEAPKQVRGEDGELYTDSEERAQAVMETLVRHIADTLGVEGGLPQSVDDWDIWLLMGEAQRAMFQHWQTVPLVRGQ